MTVAARPIRWIGSSLGDLKEFPEEVRQEVGYALYVAQVGGKHPSAKPTEGFKGATVLKIVEDHDGETYRAVYTVKFEEAVYVLHCFQKKSKSGIATPKQDLDLIRKRFKVAEEEHKRWQEQQKQK
jgi:phage-related protein